jgi:O-antigen/teichoic acid export membrane protein
VRNESIARWIHWLKLMLGRIPPADDSDRRFVSVTRGASTALAARGVALLTGLVMVPLTIGYLGSERYGAWVTISSTLSWLYVADLGLGNGLTSALSEAYGQRRADLAQHHVATAFWILAGIAAVCGLLFAAIFPHLDWAAVLNVHTPEARAEVAGAVAVAVALYLAAFPLGVIDRVYAAFQEGAIANLWSALASLAALGAVAFTTRTAGGMVALVLALSGGRLAVQLASGAWLFRRDHPELRPAPSAFQPGSLSRLTNTGGLFFIIQMAGLILFNTDNLIIAQVLGAERVTPYAVTWALFTLPSMAFTLAFPYLWPAYAEAFARKDSAWIRRTFRKSVVVSLTVGLALAVPLVVFGRPLIGIWAGKSAVPPFSLLVWMGIWSLIVAGINPVACLLNSAGHVKGQAIFASLSTAVNVGLSVYWARRYGISGVIAATVVSYLVVAAIPVCLDAAILLSRIRSSVNLTWESENAGV